MMPVGSTPGKRDMKSEDKKKNADQEHNQPNGTFSKQTSFQKEKSGQLLLGKMLVLLTAGRFKEKKENPKTNKINKIGEQTKHKT